MSELLKRILTFGLLGAILITAAIVFYNWGATPALSGEITEVRTLAMDEASSVAIINFAATNTSDRLVIIHQRELEITDANGMVRTGRPVQVVDLQQLFKYFPILGGMKDEPLRPRTEVVPGDDLRGLVAAHFDIPKHELDERLGLLLRVYNARKQSLEIAEVPAH
jgi:hypothetical protein